MAPTDFKVIELKNVAVADPVCQSGGDVWAASYNAAQDFHIEVDVPETSTGVVYGLNQTLLLAIRSAIYRSANSGEDVQLLRTPQSTKFDFKRGWLTSESADSTAPHLPFYASEAVGETQLRKDKVDGKDVYYVTLRMRRTPTIRLPSQIERKSDPKDKRDIKQLDVQELFLITLFRKEDVANGAPTPLLQWKWEHKHAWFASDNDSNAPTFEPRPSFTESCTPVVDLKDNYKLEPPIVADDREGGHHDHFVILDDEEHHVFEEESKHTVTDEWRACDA